MAAGEARAEAQHLVVLKGHPCCGKSTLARRLARRLRCPLVDKDDIKGVLETSSGAGEDGGARSRNALSLGIMWSVARRQLAQGLSCVVDTTLSNEGQMAEARRCAAGAGAELAVVECFASHAGAWRRRLEARVDRGDGARDALHKPQTWEALQRLVASYGGSFAFDPLALGAHRFLRLDTCSALPRQEAEGEEAAAEDVEATLEAVLRLLAGPASPASPAAGAGPNLLLDLPEGVAEQVCAGLRARDVGRLRLTCRQLARAAAEAAEAHAWLTCASCGTRVAHQRDRLARTSGGLGLSGDSGRFVACAAAPGAQAEAGPGGRIALQDFDARVLRLLDLYFQKRYATRYVQYNKIARLLRSEIVRLLRCRGCGLRLGFCLDLRALDAKALLHSEAVLSHSLDQSALKQYLALLTSLQGRHFLCQRFLSSLDHEMRLRAAGEAAGEDAGAGGGGGEGCGRPVALRCTAIGCRAAPVASSAHVVHVHNHAGTRCMAPVGPTGPAVDTLFVSRVNPAAFALGPLAVAPGQAHFAYRCLLCSGCGNSIGWRYGEDGQEEGGGGGGAEGGSDGGHGGGGAPACGLALRRGRWCLGLHAVANQVASGDGYVMYESGVERLVKGGDWVERDFAETARECGVGDLRPTL